MNILLSKLVFFLKILFSATAFVVLIDSAQAQELKCNLAFDASQISQSGNEASTLKDFFTQMQANFQQFISSRRWTEKNFKSNEKININILFTIREVPAQGKYKGNIQVQTYRPIFGSSYESIMINFIDKDLDFDYLPGQPLDYNDNSYISNITSILAFYSYLALAMDFDSFSPNGGTKYIEKILNTVNNAQSSPYQGWSAQASNQNSRYWLLENLNSQQFQAMRDANYEYHRQGLDSMQVNPVRARLHILNALKKIKSVNDVRPAQVLIRTFFNTKDDEIVNIFSQAEEAEKKQVYEIVTTIDPTNTEKYSKILQR